jgi:hypothetical protein
MAINVYISGYFQNKYLVISKNERVGDRLSPTVRKFRTVQTEPVKLQEWFYLCIVECLIYHVEEGVTKPLLNGGLVYL